MEEYSAKIDLCNRKLDITEHPEYEIIVISGYHSLNGGWYWRPSAQDRLLKHLSEGWELVDKWTGPSIDTPNMPMEKMANGGQRSCFGQTPKNNVEHFLVRRLATAVWQEDYSNYMYTKNFSTCNHKNIITVEAYDQCRDCYALRVRNKSQMTEGELHGLTKS